MVEIDAIKSEYCRLRRSGLDAKIVLAQLRSNISSLEPAQREQLLEILRLWEISNAAASSGIALSGRPSSVPLPVKPLQAIQQELRDITAEAQPPPPPAEAKPAPPAKPALPVTPPPPPAAPETIRADVPKTEPKVRCARCGKLNRKDDVLCSSCGNLLTAERSQFDTRTFTDGPTEMQSDEYFGPSSTLILMVKGTQETYKIRPQERRHEIIIGRGGGEAMKPDIDLTSQQAITLGVSRMHLAIAYSEKHHSLSASDLSSSNGTYINGQRLHPEEVRVLRHGDELRLGKLVLNVYFQHQTPEPPKPLAQLPPS